MEDREREQKEYEFNRVAGELRSIYMLKNQDYGDSFVKGMEEFGKISFTVRASDKMERIKQLSQAEAVVKDESFRDTLRDLANYCIMYLMWDNTKEDEKSSDDTS